MKRGWTAYLEKWYRGGWIKIFEKWFIYGQRNDKCIPGQTANQVIVTECRDEWMDPELRPMYIWSLNWYKKKVTLTLRHRLGGEGWFPADNSAQIVLYQNINISKIVKSRIKTFLYICITFFVYLRQKHPNFYRNSSFSSQNKPGYVH